MEPCDSRKSNVPFLHEDASSRSVEVQAMKESETTLKIHGIYGSDSGSYDQQATFDKRQGTSNIKGQLCKIELSMLFLLEGQIQKTAGRIDGFHLASNMEEAGDFKDIVFRYKYRDLSAEGPNSEEKSKIIFLHSMHVDDAKTKKITADVFLSESEERAKESVQKKEESEKKEEKHLVISLEKHFSSYRAIKQQFSEQTEKHPIFVNSFEDSEFLIYTNALPLFGENEDMIKEVKIDSDSFLHYNATRDRDSYYKITFGDDKGKQTEDKKSTLTTTERIICTLQNSSDCRKLAKELAKAVFSSKDGKNPEIVHQGILKKYHIPLSQTVIKKSAPKSKSGEFSTDFIDGGEKLSQDDRNFRKDFFEEARRITQKSIIHLKQELRGSVLKLSEKFGNYYEGSIHSLPNDRVTETDIREFLSKLKLFTGQPDVDHLSGIIKEKMKYSYRVVEDDISSVFFDVRAKLERWWRGETKTYLTEKTRFFQDSMRISTSFDVQRPVKMFAGRKQELNDLHRMLQLQPEKASATTQVAVITGLGGIGKTELARQFIYRYSQDFDNNVIWINAESYGTLSESFLRLAQSKLNISIQNVEGKSKNIKYIVEDVYKYFSRRKILFVFDNAATYETQDDYDSGIDKFLPILSQNSEVYILVTSSNKEWGNLKTLPLDNLKEEEATEFVKKALNIRRGFQMIDIQELCATLQCFPLALQQVVAYITQENKRTTEKRCEFSIQDYLQKYREAGSTTAKDLLDYEPESSNNYGRTTFVTLNITLRKIHSMNYGDYALHILNIMAYFASNQIFTKIFLKKGVDKRRLTSALQLLKQYSLIDVDEGEAKVHKLVQQVIRTELETQCKEKEVLTEAISLLKQMMPDKTNGKYASHAMSVWDYASKYQDLVKDFSKLPHNIMQELDTGVRYQEACSFGRTASLLLEKVLGLSHLDTLLLMTNTADALSRCGKNHEAQKAYEDLFTIFAEEFGADHFRTLRLKSSMGANLQIIGKYDYALRVFHEVLEKRREALGEEHPDTLLTMNNIATVLASLKKNTEALEIYETVLEKRRRILGSDHLDTLTTMHDIAYIYYNEGKYSQALKTYHEVFRKRRQILGPEHPFTLLTKNNMTAVHYSEQKSDDALVDYQDMVEKTERIFGSENFQSFMAKQAVAQILYQQGNYDEALVTCEELLSNQTKLLGSDHPFTWDTQRIKAAALFRQHKYGEAYSVYEELINRTHRLFGPDHLETLEAMEDKASVLSAQGMFDEALLVYQNVLERKKQTLGPQHHDIIGTEFNIAALLGRRGNYKEALKTNKEVLNKIKDHENPNTLDFSILSNATQNLVVCLTELGDYDEALKICKELHDKTEQVWGPYHKETLCAKRRIARVLYFQGQYDEALFTLQDVLDKGKQIFGHEHPSNFRTLNNIAAVLDIKGYHHMAFKTYQEVLNKRKEVFGNDDCETLETLKDIALSQCTEGNYVDSLKTSYLVLDKIKYVLDPVHPSVLLIQINIARVLSKQGKYAKSKEIYDEVLAKCKEFLGSDHPHTLDAMNDIAELLDEEGNYDRSLETYEEVLQKRTQLFKADHPSTLDTKNNMARVLAHKGQYETALKIYYEVFNKTKKILGSDNPSTLATQNNIASILSIQGYYEEALAIYKEVLEKRKTTFAQCHPDNFNTLTNIAEILGRQNEFDLSLKVYEDVLEKKIQALGLNHPDTLKTKNNIAGILFKQGNWEIALKMYFDVLEKMEALLGSFHPFVLSTQMDIAEILDFQENYEEAVHVYNEILCKSKQALGLDHPVTLRTMDKLATTMYNSGDSDKAVTIHQDVLDKEMKSLGRNHPLTALTMSKLVKELNELGRYEEVLDTCILVMEKDDILQFYNRDPLCVGHDMLHKLASEGHLEVLEHLLDNGINVLISNNHKTLLHYAVLGDNKDVINLILSKIKEQGNDIGSHINAPDEEGGTPLMWAAAQGNINAAQMLLENGADINAKDTNNQTALHWAAKSGSDDITELLLNNKAHHSTEDVNGLTALDLACEKLEDDMEILKQVRKDLKNVAAFLRTVAHEP